MNLLVWTSVVLFNPSVSSKCKLVAIKCNFDLTLSEQSFKTNPTSKLAILIQSQLFELQREKICWINFCQSKLCLWMKNKYNNESEENEAVEDCVCACLREREALSVHACVSEWESQFVFVCIDWVGISVLVHAYDWGKVGELPLNFFSEWLRVFLEKKIKVEFSLFIAIQDSEKNQGFIRVAFYSKVIISGNSIRCKIANIYLN